MNGFIINLHIMNWMNFLPIILAENYPILNSSSKLGGRTYNTLHGSLDHPNVLNNKIN